MAAALGLGSEDRRVLDVSQPQAQLWEEIDRLSPRAVVVLGEAAARALLKPDLNWSQERGKLHSLRGLSILATHSPAYLLEHPEAKREAWADLKLAAEQAQLEIPHGQR
jgi:DNA polymerase